MPPSPIMQNILSIDLESWVHFYRDALNQKGFASTSSERKILDDHYIPFATRKLLDLLDQHNQKATFFIVGEIYDWYPDVIEEIEKRGHEIGYHTHTHPELWSGDVLKGELNQSASFLERFKPMGFRAPKIFLTKDSMPHLKQWGFKYSSSTYDTHQINQIDGIDEIPVSTIRYRGKNDNNQELPKPLTLKMLLEKIPFGSGLFIGLLGAKTSYAIHYLNRKNLPAILFLHPWQIYQHEMIGNLAFKLKVLRYNPLCAPYTRNVLKPLEKLLKRHPFTSFQKYFYE